MIEWFPSTFFLTCWILLDFCSGSNHRTIYVIFIVCVLLWNLLLQQMAFFDYLFSEFTHKCITSNTVCVIHGHGNYINNQSAIFYIQSFGILVWRLSDHVEIKIWYRNRVRLNYCRDLLRIYLKFLEGKHERKQYRAYFLLYAILQLSYYIYSLLYAVSRTLFNLWLWQRYKGVVRDLYQNRQRI